MSDSSSVASGSDASASARSRRGRRILALVLVVLIALLGLSSYLLFRLIAPPTRSAGVGGTSPSTGGVEWVRSIYGTSNQANDQFGQTQAAVPGADGTIWVTDAKTRALMHFTPDGRYLGALNSTVPTLPLFMPSRMAVGPDGLIYVCETTQDMVRVLRPDGSDAGSFGIPKPVSVAVSVDRIAVGSMAGFAILDKSGKPLAVLGTRGKGEDQFDYVHGIAFDAAGNVYVADSYNNRLSAYDRAGKRLWIIRTGAAGNSAVMANGMLAPGETSGTVLAGESMLQLPLGITIDGAGRLVVADMFDCSLAVFEAKTGKFVAKYGAAGADDGQFFYPISVGYDSGRDWFTVADGFNRRVQIVRIPGSSGGLGIAAMVNRALAGPLRACLFPLLLLLLAAIVWFVVREMRRRRAARQAEEAGTGVEGQPDASSYDGAAEDLELFDDDE